MEIQNSQQRIKKIMDEKNWRQTDLYNMSKPFWEKYNDKLSKSYISCVMRGRFKPNGSKLSILSETLGVTEEWILGYNAPKYISQKMEYNDNSPKTIAAHATQDLTDDELKKVIEYAKFLKSLRKDDPIEK